MYKIVCEKKNRLTKKIIQNVKCLESFKKSSKSKKIQLSKPITIFV